MSNDATKAVRQRFQDAGEIKQSDIFHAVALLAEPQQKRAEMMDHMQGRNRPSWLNPMSYRAAKLMRFVTFEPVRSALLVRAIRPGDITYRDPVTREVSIVEITELGRELIRRNPVAI